MKRSSTVHAEMVQCFPLLVNKQQKCLVLFCLTHSLYQKHIFAEHDLASSKRAQFHFFFTFYVSKGHGNLWHQKAPALSFWEYEGLYRTIQDCPGLYSSLQDYRILYRNMQEYTGLNKTMHCCTGLYRTINNYSGLNRTI